MTLTPAVSAPRLRPPQPSLRPATPADAPFVDALIHTTMERVVRQTWRTEREVLAYFAHNAFDWRQTQIVQLAGVDVGRLSLLQSDAEVYVDQIHVLPSHQGHGVGGQVLREVLNTAHRQGRAVRLQCLRTNPAIHLYVRLGLRPYAENATHYFLRADPPAP